MKVAEYKLICSGDRSETEKLVNGLLAADWQLYGEPILRTTVYRDGHGDQICTQYGQAMIR